MAYLTKEMSKMSKLVKKLKKSKTHGKKRARDLLDSDSDSDQDIGSGSTGNLVDKHLKLNQPLGIHLKPTDNRPINSLTPKSVPAGTKNSRSEGFLLAKHKHTNIPTMMEPFFSPAAWF